MKHDLKWLILLGVILFGCCASTLPDKQTISDKPEIIANTKSPQAIENGSSSDFCLNYRERCEKITDYEKRQLCYYEAGNGVLEDTSCCTFVEAEEQRDNCLRSGYGALMYGSVAKADARDWCKYMINQTNKDACYSQYAKILGLKRTDWCKVVSEEKARDSCYLQG